MSLIVNGDKVLRSKSIGYDLIDDLPRGLTYSVENWIRPTDWITVPTPATGSEIVSMLVGVYNNVPNFLTIRASSAFSINWGDGSTQSVSSGSYARKEFSFGSYSAGTLTSDGFRQALVTVTPQTPGTFTSFDLNETHSYQSTSYKPNILEIKMSGPNLTSLSLSNTAVSSGIDRLRNFEFIGTHSITNFASLFSNADALRKVKIDFGGVTNTSLMFSGCLNLREIDSDLTKLNLVTTMANMFQNCYSLNTFPTAINASSCTTMATMFNGCYSLEETPILINTSIVADTSSMFLNCQILKKVNSFTSSSVTNMSSMFSTCYNLQAIPFFNTRWVTNFSSMFQDCIQLNSIPQLNTASASNMTSMFSGCRNLVSDKREIGIPLLNTQNVTNMTSMFLNCQKIKTIPEFNTRWVTTFQSTFQGCLDLQEVPLLNTASASRMDSMFLNCHSLQKVPLFNTQNVTNFTSMFQDCYLLSEVPNFNMATASNLSNMFNCETQIDIGGGSLYTIPNFNFSSTITGINMTNFLAGQEKLTWIPQLNTSRVTSMAGMFYACTNLRECPTLNMSIVTNTYAMFRSCINLRKVGVLNMPVNTRMDYMFFNCHNLQIIESIFTTSVLTLVQSAFTFCYKLKQIPQFNVTGVTTAISDDFRGGIRQLFRDCWSLTSAPGLTTSGVRDFNSAFLNCYSLKTAPNYDTSNATDMTSMFQGCNSLEQVPVYNISNVTSLNSVFRECFNITSITFSNISLTNNVNMSLAFGGCVKLRTVSMPGIRINSPARAFDNCPVLTSVGTFSVTSVPGGVGDTQGYQAMFNGCTQLTNLSNLTFSPSPLSSANDFRNMFSGCNSLTETPFFSMTFSSGSNWQSNMFLNCFNLSKVNIVDNKSTLSLSSCNLNYSNIIEEIGNFQTYSTITDLSNRTINFEGNPGLPEMMNFWKRKLLYDKGYTYSSGTYNWTNLNLYVQAGDTYSYTGSGTTLFDVSGLSFSTNTSPTFSNSISTTNGTLLNTPTFNTNYFEFDGTNEAINFGSSSATLLSNVTLFAVIEPLTLPAGATVSIFGRYGTSGEDNYFLDFTNQRLRFGFKQSGASTRRERILNRAFNVGQKYFVAARHQSAANSCLTWVDAVSETSYFSDNITSQTMDQTSSSILSIAGNVAANSSYANIRVYAAGIYNRLLSQEQIEELQSFFRRQGIL